MNKVIILEGPDGSGKSTLAKTLMEVHSFSVVRSYGNTGYGPKWTPAQLLFNLTQVLIEALELSDESEYRQSIKPVVIDRSFLSEWAYGQVMRDRDRLGVLGHQFFSHLTAECGVTEVICLPPWTTVLENWKVKRQQAWDPAKGTGDYVDAERKLGEIYQNYQALTFGSRRFITYDYTTDPIEKVL